MHSTEMASRSSPGSRSASQGFFFLHADAIGKFFLAAPNSPLCSWVRNRPQREATLYSRLGSGNPCEPSWWATPMLSCLPGLLVDGQRPFVKLPAVPCTVLSSVVGYGGEATLCSITPPFYVGAQKAKDLFVSLLPARCATLPLPPPPAVQSCWDFVCTDTCTAWELIAWHYPKPPVPPVDIIVPVTGVRKMLQLLCDRPATQTFLALLHRFFHGIKTARQRAGDFGDTSLSQGIVIAAQAARLGRVFCRGMFWATIATCSVFAATTFVYATWRLWVKHGDRILPRFAHQKFSGQGDIPFCCHCSPYAADMTIGEAETIKHFLLPKYCRACSWFPRFHGGVHAKIRISQRQTSTECTYTRLTDAKPTRDVDTPIVNQLDGADKSDQCLRFYQKHVGVLAAQESMLSFMWQRHTNSYRMATEWIDIPDMTDFRNLVERLQVDAEAKRKPDPAPPAPPPNTGDGAPGQGGAPPSPPSPPSSSSRPPGVFHVVPRAAVPLPPGLELYAPTISRAASVVEPDTPGQLARRDEEVGSGILLELSAETKALLADLRPLVADGIAALPDSPMPLGPPVPPTRPELPPPPLPPPPPRVDFESYKGPGLGMWLLAPPPTGQVTGKRATSPPPPLPVPPAPPPAAEPDTPEATRIMERLASAKREEAIAARPATGAWSFKGLSGITNMRSYWSDVVNNAGLLPKVSYIKCCRDLLDKFTGTETKHYMETDAVRIALRAINPASYMFPPLGMTAGATFGADAQACGIPLTTPLIHDISDKAHASTAAEKRLEVENHPAVSSGAREVPYRYKAETPAAAKYNKFFHALMKKSYTPKRIMQAYDELFGTVELWEVHMAAFGEEARLRAMELNEVLRRAMDIRPRKANGKLEMVEKDGKAVRFVIDNGLEFLMVNRIITKIFEHLDCSKSMGVFYKMSIKGRPRDVVLDDFGKRCSKKVRAAGQAPGRGLMAGWEIDQTGMEKHERLDRHGRGLMAPIYQILQRICSVISSKLCGKFAHIYSVKLFEDQANGMRIQVELKGEHLPTGKKLMLKFDDLYLDSGWSLTSVMNRLVENVSTFCAMVDDPERLLETDTTTGEFLLRTGKFSWCFKSIPLWISPDQECIKQGVLRLPGSPEPILASVPVVLEGLFEGDDGGGQCSRVYVPVENQTLVTNNMADMGLCGKLVMCITGRIEIIGAHFAFTDGALDASIRWCPAVGRSVGKIGAVVGKNLTLESKVARFWSLASAFCGRVEPMYDIFMASAFTLLEKSGHGDAFMDTKIIVREYDETERWLVAEKMLSTECKVFTLRQLHDIVLERSVMPYPPQSAQLDMMNNSVGKSVRSGAISMFEFGRLGMLATDIEDGVTIDNDAEALYSMLPRALQQQTR